jgi:membrane associated rhomboid family serine protease
MVRRGSRGRWFWRIGSWLYSAGLLGIVLVLIVGPVMFYFRFGKLGVGYAAALLGMGGLVVLGSFLRRVSYRIALNEGIDIVGFLREPAEPGK